MPPTIPSLDDIASAVSGAVQSGVAAAEKLVDGTTPDDVMNAAQAVAGATAPQGNGSSGGGASVLGDLGNLIGQVPDTIARGKKAIDDIQSQVDSFSAQAHTTLDSVNSAAQAAQQTARDAQAAIKSANATVSKVGEAAQQSEVAGAVAAGVGLLGLIWLMSRKK